MDNWIIIMLYIANYKWDDGFPWHHRQRQKVLGGLFVLSLKKKTKKKGRIV